ncbi:hypothetical protein [Spirosoma sp.]|uniref:hypothetical protein n=1 Tax=Spirosoma sp. TaxID=1899569 RepID=UPI003B3B365C
MQTTVNWTNSINWVIAVTLLIVLIGQLWLIARNQSLTNGRKWIRVGLNVMLCLVLTGYFLQIQWPVAKPATHALLIADNVPSAFTNRLKDSLSIRESFTSRNFKPEYDSVTLVGQNFPVELLTQLSNARLQWIPYSGPDQLQDIRWKSMVRQGEMQHVTGRIASSKEQLLRLRFGNKTLDSSMLQKGENSFNLRFPAFTQGQSQVELVLEPNTLDTVRFFARRTQPLSVQFLLNSPDFESKTLADWLGKHGHSVQLSATLSKDISSNVSINKSAKSTGKIAPDLIVTEPTNANNVAVRKAVADGKGVLFINLTNPETDCRSINQGTGSSWQVRKTSNEATVPVGTNLTALPYRFADNLNQFMVPGYPIAVQQTNGRVGVSLLSETYPLSLSGDSATYNRVWMAVLARLSQADKNTIQTEAPIYQGIQQTIYINNPSSRYQTIRVGNDKLALTYSALNDRLAKGTSSFRESGWQTMQDSLAIYVEESTAPLRTNHIVRQFMLAHQNLDVLEAADRKAIAKLPEWGWLLLFVICFTALWIEPKLGQS